MKRDEKDYQETLLERPRILKENLTPIKLLFIEDDAKTINDLHQAFAKSPGVSFDIHCANTLEAGIELLKTSTPDVILTDLYLPDSQGLDTIDKIYTVASFVPIFVLTSTLEEWMPEALRRGATEYLLKKEINGKLLSRFIRYAVEFKRANEKLILEHKAMDKALKQNEAILKSVPAGIGLVRNRTLEWVNNQLLDMLGYKKSELINQSARILYESDEEFERVGKVKYEKIKQCGSGDVDTRWVCKDGKALNIYLKSVAIDPKDISAGVIFTASDITERKKIMEALRESELRYRTVVEHQTEFICRNSPDGVITFVNDAYCHYFGKRREELIGKSFMPLIPDEDHKRVKDYFSRLNKDNPIAVHEHRVIRPSGEIRWHQWTNRVIFDQEGRIVEYQGVGHDITERKLAEEALKSSEERYKLLLKSATDYLYAVTVKDGRPVSTYHGPGCIAVTGYASYDYERDSHLWYRMIYEEDRASVLEQAAMAQRGVDPPVLEHRIIHKDGSVRWIRNALVIRRDEKGRVVAYDGLITDITARRQAEEKLKESEAKYRLLFDHIPAGVCHVDAESKFVFVNDIFCKMFESNKKDVIGKSFLDFVHPDNQKIISERFRQSIVTIEVSKQPLEVKCLTAKGKIIFIMIASTILTKDNRFVGFQTTVQDVTLRRQTEEIMHEQSAAIKASMDGMAIHNSSGEFVYLNESHAGIYGYDSADELIGKSWRILYDHKELERFDKDIMPRFWKERMWRGEAVGKRKNGSLYPQEISLTALEDGGLVCVVRDITDRKKAEQELYYRVEFEKLIDQISAQFINLTPDKVDEGIYQALRAIGEFAGVDRSFVFSYSERIDRIVNIYEWCAEGVPSQAHRLMGVSAKNFPWFERILRTQKVVHITRLHDLPAEAAAEKKEFEAQGLKSLICVPMIYEGTLVGFVGFDKVHEEKTWPDDTIALLKIIGEIFTNALQRKASEEQLMKINQCFLNFGPDPIVNINQLVAACGGLLKADWALYNRVIDGAVYNVGKWNAPADIELINGTKGHICCELVEEKRDDVVVIRDLLNTRYARPGTLLAREGLKTYVGQTIKFGKAYIGVLCTLFKNDFIPTDADKRLMGVFASAIGIEEERQRIEEALRANEALLRTVFDTMPHWVFVKDTRSRMLLVNKKMAADYGVPPEELINVPTEETPLGKDEEKAFFIGVDQQVISTGEGVEIPEEKITKPNGEVRYLHTIKVPLKNAYGKVIGLVGVAQDISERKKAEQELDDYRKHLEELVEERTRELRHSERLAATGRLAASIAHEINNPLQGITTHLEIMRDHFPKNFEKLKNYESVRSNIEKIRGIVTKLLDTYRGTDEGKTVVDVNELVEKVASLIEHQLKLKNIHLKLNLEKDIPKIHGWKQQLHQVLLNLILNAQDSIKASAGEITMTTSSDNGAVSIAVADTGEGIKKPDMDRLFEPFFTTKLESGTGLGLFVSQGIVKEHNGSIKVKSKFGKGSEFTVTLPALVQETYT